jgi:phosphoribosylformimino-5-aminoimidazole carboxamide ribotide isomerase
MQLIPAIDLRGGHCVRLLRGDFAAETRYERTPLELLQHYRAIGARWLHVVDLDGARDGQLANRATIVQLAAQTGINVQLGGGVRSTDILEELLALGVARVVIGSAAVEQREQVSGWLSHYGAERICLALDVRHDDRQQPLLHTRGWRQATALSLWDAVQSYLACGLRHVLCTDIERDGALAGPNLALYVQAVARFPQVQWQASGGVSSGADLAALAACGVAAAISGKALLENRLPDGALQPYLPGA